ncbi:hypothetical protein Leryth_020123 [Lithospermum erythrorhizon]|nr:hypothetical protein Leryth_020123 [Lithospermum erythrorhizon]
MGIIDLIHMFLNFCAPIFTFFSLLLILPPFYLFKSFMSIVNTVFSEDMSGKVVLITGASSGIGEHLAYEYASRGACLVLCARRVEKLHQVAQTAREMGALDAVVIPTDVVKIDDCKRAVHQTITYFGRLDHLVNNAGITSICLLEDVTDFRTIMDINFWGSVYMTSCAAPYLRLSRGRIIVLSSAASWLPAPRMSFYNASKAAMAQFFETMRVEFGPDIGITLVTPGFVESEITQGKFLDKGGHLEVHQEMRDVQVSLAPVARTESCAKAIVRTACRGERYVTEPAWFRTTLWWHLFCPELMEWLYRIMYITNPGEPASEALSKKILDASGAKALLYPETMLSGDVKTE